MLVVVDMGNTNITMGLYKEDTLIGNYRLTTKLQRTSDEYGFMILSFLALLKIFLKYKFLYLHFSFPFSLINRIKNTPKSDIVFVLRKLFFHMYLETIFILSLKIFSRFTLFDKE